MPILLKSIYENSASNILTGHSDTVVSAQFSQDDSKIFTVSKDKTAKIWNLKGQVLKTVNKHIDDPKQTQFNKQGDRLVTIAEDKVLKILDIESNVIQQVEDIRRAVFSDDGRKIIAYPDSNKKSVLVLDLQGKLIHEFKLPEVPEDFNFDAYYRSISVSSDATKLIYPTKSNTLKILDHQNNVILEIQDASRAFFNKAGNKIIVHSSNFTLEKEERRIFDLHNDQQVLKIAIEDDIKHFSINNDGSKIVTLSDVDKDGNQIVKLSDLQNNQINQMIVEFKVTDIDWVYFSNNHTKIVTNSRSKKIEIWDMQGNYVAEVKDDINKQLTFNNDRSQFINIDGNKLRLFDITNIANESDIVNKFILIQGNSSDIKNFSRDDNRILTIFKDEKEQTVKLSDLQGNLIGAPIKLNSNESAYINNNVKKIVITDQKAKKRQIFDLSGKLNADIEGIATTFNKDGSRIATRLANKILLWDAQGNRMGTEIDTGLNESEWKSMNFSSDGTKLIVIAEKKLQIWDLASRQKVTKDIKRAFSDNNSNIIVTLDDNGTFKCWDLKGNLIKEINVKQTDDDSVSFSRDGKYFLTTSGENSNKKVQIWDMQGNLVGSPKQDFGDISRAEFSFDGQKLITYAKDNTVRIWDITGNLTAELKGHKEAVNSVKLSADSSKIVTASRDKTLRVWDATGNLIGIISAPNASIFSSADFSADGSKIVAFASDGKARVYDNNFATNDEQLWQLGCKKLADYLTYNPKATEEDKKMCGIAIDKK